MTTSNAVGNAGTSVQVRSSRLARRIAAGAAACALAACSATGSNPPEVSPHGPSGSGGAGSVTSVDYVGADIPFAATSPLQPSDREAVTQRINAIGLDMLTEAYDKEVKEGENFAFSPVSLYVALSAVATLADHDLGKEFSDYLGADEEMRAQYVSNLIKAYRAHTPEDLAQLASKDLPEKPMIHIGNNIVINERIPAPADPYIATLRGHYDADITRLPIAQIKPALDAWARENTGGLIDQSGLEVTPDFLLGLQSALYFASAWRLPFEENATDDKPFYLHDGSKITVPTMFSEQNVEGFTTGQWTGVRIPMAEDEYYAEFLMPADSQMTGYSGEDIEAVRENFANSAKKTKVFIPRFEVSSSLQLLDALDAKGLTLEGVPQFSAVAKDAVISQAVQQAVIEVKEAGVRAAALTEIGMVEAAAPVEKRVRTIKIDHPFLFFIRSVDNGEELFSAVIFNPAQ